MRQGLQLQTCAVLSTPGCVRGILQCSAIDGGDNHCLGRKAVAATSGMPRHMYRIAYDSTTPSVVLSPN